MSHKLVPLIFLSRFGSINAGEVAGYTVEDAKKLVSRGIAEPYDPDKKETVADSEPDSELEAKIMMDVEELMGMNIKDIEKELEATISSGAYLYGSEYISSAADHESLNKGRSGLLDTLLSLVEERENGE